MSVCKGRFDCIKRGFVGVCAATMLTGLCAAPALAADFTAPTHETGTEASYGDSGTATTDVKVQALSDAQVSATVPTSVVASVSADGTLTFPAPSAMKISLGKDSDKAWPAEIKKLSVAMQGGNGLAAADSLSKDNNLCVTLNGTALTLGDNDLTGFKQDVSGAVKDIELDMAGKMYQPTFQAMKDGVQIASLTWTISLV